MTQSLERNPLISESGMIETTFLPKKQLDHREGLLKYVIAEFGQTLDEYEIEIDKLSAQSQVPDDNLQRNSLSQIRETFAKIQPEQKTLLDLIILGSDPSFSIHLQTLELQTFEHLHHAQSRIRQFSEEVRTQHRTTKLVAWFCTGFAVLMVGLLWWVFRTQVAKPFQTLLDGCRLVAAGQFRHRIDLGTNDELSELAQAMNNMSEQFLQVVQKQRAMNAELDQQVQDRTREVIQNEQLASVGFLAAGVAHEINNPLASIAFSAETLERQVDDVMMVTQCPDASLHGDLKKNLRRIHDEAFRCSDITKRLLDFSRLGDVSRTSVNMGDLVEGVVDLVRKVGKFRCKTIQTHCQSSVFAHVNPHEIQQVVLNLVTNALESVDTDGAVDVHVRNEGPFASVSVKDNGCGMSKEVLAHLFEPFFTRRRDGTGTGLGLSITYRIVSQHHGSLVAHSDGEGKGSSMDLLLPTEPFQEDKLSGEHQIQGSIDVTTKAA